MMDQVAWAECNVPVGGGGMQNFKRDALLPAPDGDAELAYRATLRMLGAVRAVQVVHTAEELAAAAAPSPAPPGEEAAPAVTTTAGTAVLVGPEEPPPFKPGGGGSRAAAARPAGAGKS